MFSLAFRLLLLNSLKDGSILIISCFTRIYRSIASIAIAIQTICTFDS